MTDDANNSTPTTSTTSPTAPRPKPVRSSTSVVRTRSSPPPAHPAEQSNDGRPPTKRARKAINCEPCRNSKLKCDRSRPCSSCVLRGTSAMCYQDARGHEGSDSFGRGDDHHYARIDPAQEIARIRQSVSLIESYVFPHQRNVTTARRASDAALITPKKEPVEPDVSDKNATAPGMLGTQQQGGLYAGPTSAATHLLMVGGTSLTESRDSDDSESRQQSQDRVNEDFPSMTQDYDRDLLSLLPSVDIIDGLIKYYFEYCNWIYRHVSKPSFTLQWERYKSGAQADRVVLATACALMAIATHYLPVRHPLLEGFGETHEEIGLKFFDVSTTSFHRHTAETRKYTLELIELMLVRTHFLTLSKTDSEEIWHVKGELITIGTAMGLHRDPGRFRMSRDVAERRRWAWWHIILLERWQAFMFGRPITMASHHFDTQLPSFCDPAVDKTGRLYLPNIALFRLAFILGDIMDDAVSVRPVPYESVLANDRALAQWMDNLPPEMDLDEFRVARSLASSNVAQRRLGVQSIIIRTSYYHIRFTLHRPYASSAANGKASSKDDTAPIKSAQSLEIAVSAADKLITMVGQSRPDFLANSSLAVPGHMNWGPFHCFSAAMFFSFQLIANPDQAGAGLFRESIRKAIATLEQSRGITVANKAYDILQALAPLYSPEFPLMTTEVRDKKRAQVLGTVRKLAFPYHDSHDPRRFGESPSGRGTMSSPANSSSVSPPLPVLSALPQHYDTIESHMRLSSGPSSSTSANLTNSTSPSSNVANSATLYSSPHCHQSLAQAHVQNLTHSPQAPVHVPAVAHPQTMTNYQYATSTMPGGQPSHLYSDPRYYVQPVEENIWGAAIGFGQGEWAQLLDGLRPDVSQTIRHG